MNGPEWRDSDIVDSDDSMETSQGCGRMREKIILKRLEQRKPGIIDVLKEEWRRMIKKV